jgi:predicted transport protein
MVRMAAGASLGYLHLDPARVVPMPPNGLDVSQKGHWGTGDLELSLSSQADLDAAKPLILMAYEGRAPVRAVGV